MDDDYSFFHSDKDFESVRSPGKAPPKRRKTLLVQPSSAIPIPIQTQPSEAQKKLFVAKKVQVVLPKNVQEDKMLQDDFSKPVCLDTRVFRMLSYALANIYARVDEQERSSIGRALWRKEKLTHAEAETLNQTLHRKFASGQIRDSADFLEQTKAATISDLFNEAIRLKNKYLRQVSERNFRVAAHDCAKSYDSSSQAMNF